MENEEVSDEEIDVIAVGHGWSKLKSIFEKLHLLLPIPNHLPFHKPILITLHIFF